MTESRQITDAQTMRALAHPVRVALLEALQRDGELTATGAAELFDENPGNMSWHLQTLAKYGFIEEAPDRKGRSRPWRLRDNSPLRFSDNGGDTATAAMAGALAEQLRERVAEESRRWMANRSAFPPEWNDNAFSNYSIGYLTASELGAVSDEIALIFERYSDRSADRRLRPDDALPVRLTAAGFPLPPTPSGN